MLHSIFRSYDIRGIYPREINAEVAALIGRAFARFLPSKKPLVVVGRDNRASSATLSSSLMRGLLSGNAKIIDIGLSTTPMLYFAAAHYKYDGGIQVTASHNPPQYNGFKFVGKAASPITQEGGLKEIKNIVQQVKDNFILNKEGKKIYQKEVIKDYLDFILQDFQMKKINKKIEFVADTANAVSGILIQRLKEKIPLKIHHLFKDLNSKFPAHEPDPLKKENLVFLQKEVKKRKASFGVAFDGDGDRVCFVDEKGEIVNGDLVLAFLANEILKEKKGQVILYDIRSSNIVPETIKKAGGVAVMSRVGHSFIKEKMRKEDAVFGGELSGHYYHKNYYFCEAPFFVLFKIIEAISREKKPFSRLIQPYRKYFQSGEINFEIKEKEKILELLEKKFAKRGKLTKIDGLRVDFPDWWFLARPSGTEDLLRICIEAKNEKTLEEKKRELSALVQLA